MFKLSTTSFRAVPRTLSPAQTLRNTAARRRLSSQGAKGGPPHNVSTGKLAAAAAASLGALAAYRYFGNGLDVHADIAPVLLPVNIEAQKSKLSAQHAQVVTSLESPGVFAWGDNSGKVIDPNSDEKVIKTPRRLAMFDGVLLRDLKLDKEVGVAVNEAGDVLQWGIGFSKDSRTPQVTLKGKNIEKIELTADKVVALSKDKQIYTFPISHSLQLEGAKVSESGWVPGTSSESPISYRTIKPELGFRERITNIATGRDHLLILTSSGRVFTSASSFTYPLKGQLGIPALTYRTRPADKPIDTAHPLSLAEKVTQIAAGDYHSVLLTSTGRVFTFGDNLHGQLGFDFNPDTDSIDSPKELKIASLYPSETPPKVSGIAAGGANTYFKVDVPDAYSKKLSADVLACGTGIYGNLGNGRWTHVQGTPSKIKALSNLFEYSEAKQTLMPIRPAELHVGATHAAAVMDNDTNTTATGSAVTDVNFGSDVLWWGNNEFYQLGTGKRNNSNVPVYIGALDQSVVQNVTKAGITGSASRGGTNGEEKISGVIGGDGGDPKSGMFTGKDQVHRFQITPAGKTKSGKKAKQTLTLGRGNTAVYMKVV